MTDEGDSGRVLVVEDSAAARYPLAEWLGHAGYDVVRVATGAEALEQLDQTPIDLVVLDVPPADRDGSDLCERIKADPRYAALPVIHVAVPRSGLLDRARGVNHGADVYLAEPIEQEELVATAQAVLRYARARRRAELLATRLAQLAEATMAVNSAATFEQMLRTAAESGAGIFEAPVVVVAETADGESLAGICAGVGCPAEVQTWSAPSGEVAVGATVFGAPPADWGLGDRVAGESVTVAAARLRTDRPPVYVAAPAVAVRKGAPVLIQLAQAIAAAVETQRSYDEEHRIAVTLQRSLLPHRLPEVPGFDLAVRYEPASTQTEVGGDFYEIAMIDRRLWVAIGDVAGHSLHAATVMAELRHAIRAYAVEGHSPGGVLARADKLLDALLPGELATICLMMVDPMTGSCRMASAGHLPPLLVAADGGRFVDHRAPLLGVRAGRPEDREFVLPPGSTLVLYTDGLVERRGADIDDGLQALAACATEVDDDLDRYCERLVVDLVAPEMHDDIAVVALRRR